MGTKAEFNARLQELLLLQEKVGIYSQVTEDYLSERIPEVMAMAEAAEEDMAASVVRSHIAICAAKDMGLGEAYGQDPAVYYGLAICGESGEMGNKIVKALRNGNDARACKKAVISELPDVFIYGFVLAYVLGIDIVKLVNEKVDVVIQRAADGYYGGPLKKRRRRKLVVPPVPSLNGTHG